MGSSLVTNRDDVILDQIVFDSKKPISRVKFSLDIVNRCCLDHFEVFDVGKAVVGFTFEDSNKIIQTICGNFEVREFARNPRSKTNKQVQIVSHSRCHSQNTWNPAFSPLQNQSK